MATTYLPPQNISVPTLPSFSLPTLAASLTVANPFSFLPPAPLLQTLFGTAAQTSFST